MWRRQQTFGLATTLLVWSSQGCSLDSGGESMASSGAGASGGSVSASSGEGGAAASSSSGSGEGGSGASGGKAGGAGGECATASSADYLVGAVSAAELTRDGDCNEPIWSAAPVITFSGLDESDNTVSCRLLWEDAAIDRLHGCCTMGDLDVQGASSGADAEQIFLDDGLEYFFGGTPTTAWDATTTKVMMSVSGAWHDGSWASGMNDPDYTANVELAPSVAGDINGGDRDVGYTLEWSADLGFDGKPEQIGQCNFMMNDDDQGRRFRRVAFGTWQSTFNDASLFGTCKLSCAPP